MKTRETYWSYIDTITELMEEPNNMSPRLKDALTEAVHLLSREAMLNRTTEKVAKEGFR